MWEGQCLMCSDTHPVVFAVRGSGMIRAGWLFCDVQGREAAGQRKLKINLSVVCGLFE